jgi:predicted nucleotidyltransferase
MVMVPENKIEENMKEFVEKARAAAGANLQSVILYGSAASGDYHAEFSNVNLFCVVRDSSYAKMQALAPVVKWWDKQNQPPPLVMTREELNRSTDVFTIELIDMKQHHRMLWGDDVLKSIEIPMDLHRVQVEYELREKLILLRQHLLLAGDDENRVRELLVRSVSSFATLFRHVLIALGEDAPVSKRGSVTKLAARLGFNSAPMERVLAVRERQASIKTLAVGEVASAYLQSIEKVTDAVDTMPGTSASSHS